MGIVGRCAAASHWRHSHANGLVASSPMIILPNIYQQFSNSHAHGTCESRPLGPPTPSPFRFGAQELFRDEPVTTTVTADPTRPTAVAATTEIGSTATDEGAVTGASDQADKGPASDGPGAAAEGSADGVPAAAVGMAEEAESAAAAAASSQRIVWDAAALERLLDRSALEARHAASLAAGEGGMQEEGEEEEGQADLMRAFKVGRTEGEQKEENVCR